MYKEREMIKRLTFGHDLIMFEGEIWNGTATKSLISTFRSVLFQISVSLSLSVCSLSVFQVKVIMMMIERAVGSFLSYQELTWERSPVYQCSKRWLRFSSSSLTFTFTSESLLFLLFLLELPHFYFIYFPSVMFFLLSQ